ncbi:MAG: hypothetical protein K1X94_30535 [Sandaracinaceae bacterium]|nr:hypothetical protein [Sandaracinaceae bacterium]
MARGEAPKERPSFPGAAIGAAFMVFCLCGVTGVALTTHECNAALAPAVVTPEPFVGTIATFHALSWRDSGRVRWGTAIVPDPAARAIVESSLTGRGYVPAPSEGAAPVQALPADFEAPALEGACGLLVLVGDASTTLTRAEVSTTSGTESFSAHDPSVLPVPVCGNQRVHVEGAGSAAAHAWLYPGLTREVVEATGLPVDVVLAHAEAEVLLTGRSLAPMDEVAVLEVPTGTGPQTIPMTRGPASGCVVLVGVIVGGGDPVGAWNPPDRVPDRGLVGLGRCLTRTDAIPSITVPSGTARVYVRPYRAVSGTASTGVTAGALHVVREADLSLPPPLVEAPMP